MDYFVKTVIALFPLLLLVTVWKSREVFFKGNEKPDKKKLVLGPAICAIALIAVLSLALQPKPLSIESQVTTFESATLINELMKYPKEYWEIKKIMFNFRNTSMDLRAIAAKTETIAFTQLCLAKGDFTDNDFKFAEVKSNVVLDHVGNSEQNARIGAICDQGKDLLADFKKFQEQYSIILGEMHCGNGKDKPDETAQTFCLLVLRKA